MSDGFTTRTLFEQLGERRFPTSRALEAAVRELFNAHRAAFPAGYTYVDAIDWGRVQGWIAVEANELAICVPGVAA